MLAEHGGITIDWLLTGREVPSPRRAARSTEASHQLDCLRDPRTLVPLPAWLSSRNAMTHTVEDRDVAHLRWMPDQLGSGLLDAVVVTTGPHAYRRRDGIAVVPAALLGP